LFTVFVELELGDNDVGGVDGDGDALAVGLLADDTLDVDNPLETVDGGDLAFPALAASPDHGDLVILANRNGLDLFSSELR
jgi:hypothetical protein